MACKSDEPSACRTEDTRTLAEAGKRSTQIAGKEKSWDSRSEHVLLAWDAGHHRQERLGLASEGMAAYTSIDIEGIHSTWAAGTAASEEGRIAEESRACTSSKMVASPRDIVADTLAWKLLASEFTIARVAVELEEEGPM